MARQQSGGQSRGQSRGGGTTTGARSGASRTANTGGTNTGASDQKRGAQGGGARSDAQSGGQGRGSNTAGSSRESSVQGAEQIRRAGVTSDQGQMGEQRESAGQRQSAEQRPDQERQLETARERSGASIGGTAGRSRTTRQQGEALSSQGQGQSSLLPALMANPWLLTNAFLSNPFGVSQALNQELDRLFAMGGDIAPGGRISSGGQEGQRNAASRGQTGRGLGQWAPQVEVRQQGKELTICADLPGMKPEDVNIELEDGVLTISGERQQSSEDRQEGFYRSERSYGSFARSIPLPEGVDENQVQAKFEHGVLEVTVPIPEQRQRGRKIQIQTGGGAATSERNTTSGVRPAGTGQR